MTNPLNAGSKPSMAPVWTSFAFTGMTKGTEAQPLNSLVESANLITTGQTVKFVAGGTKPWTAETGQFKKAMKRTSVGTGGVRLGDPSP